MESTLIKRRDSAESLPIIIAAVLHMMLHMMQAVPGTMQHIQVVVVAVVLAEIAYRYTMILDLKISGNNLAYPASHIADSSL